MNGHDDDGNETNGNSAASSARGIFSTPELTVDAEKIAQNQKSDRSRMASIFANTDAGQRSQKLNNAMGISSQSLTSSEMQSVSEDVATNKVPRKRSKTPFIIALVLLLVIGIGVGVYFLVNGLSTNTQISQRDAFNEYYDYLKNGPEAYRQSELNSEEWFVFTLDDQDMTNSEQAEYTAELLAKFQTFQKLVTGDELKQQVQAYSQLLNTFINASQLNVLSQNLSDKFFLESPNAAFLYIQDLANSDIDASNSTISAINDAITNYLNKQLSLLEIYSTNNCVVGASIDYGCVFANINTTSGTVFDIRQEQTKATNLINYNMPIIETTLQTETQTIANKVEGKNE